MINMCSKESLKILEALVVFGLTSIVISIIAVANAMDRKRRAALQKVADKLGLDFYPKGSEKLESDLQKFVLTNKGRDRKLTKLIQGQSDEVKISIFDYQYTVGSGKSSRPI